ncbi:MAG: RnfABCDGE type electron transport complex subunit D [Eubacteriales bacterium]|nr:RnfABCDGE type electron transport complex subunit D [Eubacteriales bacterium]MDD3881603.1 RnfABCDGE type electron transport complex subunit D [Eubacteriales bacterium]MDD4512338.1 RnfABCDGE type electron transport complex subunit D [Eubacteriales bacterium]
MQKQFTVSTSPHLRDSATTSSIMLEVCLALLPAGIMGILFFGFGALLVIAACVLTCVIAEYLWEKHTHKPITIKDGSAILTGLLLAYNLPPTAPIWLCIVGSAIAIIIVKQFFGGLGQNFLNPALAARAILMVSWAGIMTTFIKPEFMGFLGGGADAVSVATPLALGQSPANYSLWQLIIGDIPGTIGETSKLALLLGGVYLMWRRIIDWRTPVCFIATAFVLFLISTGKLWDAASNQSAIYQILSGGLFLGAFFMATDYVTSPITKTGKIIMGVGCGALLFVIRSYSSYVEGCSFAILLMNVITPLIDRFTPAHPFGEVKRHE